MKKLFLLIGCLALTSACQGATSTPQVESTPTAATPTRPNCHCDDDLYPRPNFDSHARATLLHR